MTLAKSKSVIYQSIAVFLICLIFFSFALEINASVILQSESEIKSIKEAETVVIKKPYSKVIISDPGTNNIDKQIQEIVLEAKHLIPLEVTTFQKSYNPNLDSLAEKYGVIRDFNKERNIGHSLLNLIYKNNKHWEAELKKQGLYESMLFFITYDHGTTAYLGAGERAGVIDFWKKTKNCDLCIPTNVSDWEDIIKIANGRWPNVEPENEYVKSKEDIFRKIYLRNPDYSNINDEAAMMVMAYGIRPLPRNVDSENEAVGFFKGIYNRNPVSSSDWDIVRAVSYSGAIR